MSDQQNITTGTRGARYQAIRDLAVGESITFGPIDYSEKVPGSFNPFSLRGAVNYYQGRYNMRLTMNKRADGSAIVRRLK